MLATGSACAPLRTHPVSVCVASTSFLVLQDAPDLPCVLSAPVLESAVSPRSPGSLCETMILETKIWEWGTDYSWARNKNPVEFSTGKGMLLWTLLKIHWHCLWPFALAKTELHTVHTGTPATPPRISRRGLDTPHKKAGRHNDVCTGERGFLFFPPLLLISIEHLGFWPLSCLMVVPNLLGLLSTDP